MAIKIEMLRCFSTVARTGNLADAAVRLGRTQSAVSMTLKQLEDHLGQRLFESERKNRLTAFGQEVAELARRQIRQFDETISAIETSARAPGGLVRLASVPSIAGVVFPQAVDFLAAARPGLEIELRDADTEQVLDALVRGHTDFGIVSGVHSLNGIGGAVLFEDPLGLVAAVGHPLALRKTSPQIGDIDPADFLRNPLCALVSNAAFHRMLPGTRISVQNTLSLIAMVRAGRWVTLLPRTVVGLLPGEIVFRPIAGLSDHRAVSLLFREKSTHAHLFDDLCGIVRALAPVPAPGTERSPAV